MPARKQTSAPGTRPIGSRLRNRIYEAVTFRDVLEKALEKRDPPVEDLVGPKAVEDPAKGFEKFLDKISQICDSRIGGDTMTSAVVLQDLEGVVYVAASNRRTPEECREVKTFLRAVLNKVAVVGESEINGVPDEALRSDLLGDIVSFNLNRFWCWTRRVCQHLTKSLRALEADTTSKGIELRSILTELDSLLLGIDAYDDSSEEDEDEVQAIRVKRERGVKRLIKYVRQLHENGAYAAISERAGERDSCWTELRYNLGRIHSYGQSVPRLMQTFKTFPMLFENFEVNILASSPSDVMSFVKQPQTMHKMIGRMTGEDELMRELRGYAAELGPDRLDEAIRESWYFPTTVHAETRLVDWLERDGEGVTASRFFRRIQYVGCSKGSCLLCRYYIEARDSRLRMRPCHDGFYKGWRLPDLPASTTDAEVKKVEEIARKVLDKLNGDLVRVLKERVIHRKKHDTHTCTTDVIENDEVDDVALDLETLSLNGEASETASSDTA